VATAAGSPRRPPSVGVVIPSCRRPELLGRALASVAEQSAPPLDVVVVHDEPAVPARWLVDGGGARHLSTGGGRGASAARNLGAEAVAGSHLAFLDDDDRWKPSYLHAAGDALARSGAEMALADVERVRGGQRRPGTPVRPGMTGTTALAENTGVTGSSIVIARAAFERVGGFDDGLPAANDLDFLVRALDAGVAYVPVGGCLVEYHEHDGERLTTSQRRADGLTAFRAKWADRLTRADLRRMDAEVLGIRRRATSGRARRLALVGREAWLLGWRATLERARDLRRWSDRPPPTG
jgi:GT2 family glycosyltransferase